MSDVVVPEQYTNGWHVWIVFRSWSRQDDWRNWAVALRTRSRMIHVEFLFRAILSNPNRLYIPAEFKVDSQKDDVSTRIEKNIKLKKLRKQLQALPRRLQFNWYTITCAPPPGTDPNATAVRMLPSKQYHRSTKRFFVKLPLQRESIKRLWRFLEAQVGKPFNEDGERWNFLPCMGYHYGCQSEQLIHSAPSWFCSELATAALQEIGFFKEEQPCLVSPSRLSWLLQREFECDFLDNVPHDLCRVVCRK